MICLINYKELGCFQRLIKGQVIINLGLSQETFPKLHLELDMALISLRWCLLGLPMPLLHFWVIWIEFFIFIWTNLWWFS